jgi:hypothetical protein
VKRASTRTSSFLRLGELVGGLRWGMSASVNQRQMPERRTILVGRTFRTTALLFRTGNLEILQARYTWVFVQFCVGSYEKRDRTRISTARGALDLRGTVGILHLRRVLRGWTRRTANSLRNPSDFGFSG